MRTADPSVLACGLIAHGFYEVMAIQAADLFVMRPGPAQLHLGLWTGSSLIHADAGLRRVVELPGVPPWPVLSIWRRAGEGEN